MRADPIRIKAYLAEIRRSGLNLKKIMEQF